MIELWRAREFVADSEKRRAQAPPPRPHTADEAARWRWPQSAQGRRVHMRTRVLIEQFLFLRYEDLMRMNAISIVRLLGHFTGLTVNPSYLQKDKCEATKTSAHGHVLCACGVCHVRVCV